MAKTIAPRNAKGTVAVPPISDADVQRLIEGTDTRTLVFYDASDCQIYGHKHRRELTGKLANDASIAGCEPTVYQSIEWFSLVYVPIWPLGTYFVMPCRECYDPDGDGEQYRSIRAKSDRCQIAIHYWVLAVHLIVAGLGSWFWWR